MGWCSLGSNHLRNRTCSLANHVVFQVIYYTATFSLNLEDIGSTVQVVPESVGKSKERAYIPVSGVCSKSPHLELLRLRALAEDNSKTTGPQQGPTVLQSPNVESALVPPERQVDGPNSHVNRNLGHPLAEFSIPNHEWVPYDS